MTIKQQGGIFGRNPTFNDLTAGSGSSIEGSGDNVTFSVDRTDASTDGALVLRAANGTLSIDSDGADKDILIRTGGSTERARFYGDSGDFSIKGNLVVDDGQGIDFSATSGTGTSELFSDYEEGSWTPTFDNGYTAGSTSGTYTKIGNTVFVTLDIVNIGTSGAGGFLKITGLPYTPSEDSFNGDFIIRTDFDFTSGMKNTAPVASSSGYISLYQSFNDATGFAVVTDANFTGGGLTDLKLSMTYFTA